MNLQSKKSKSKKASKDYYQLRAGLEEKYSDVYRVDESLRPYLNGGIKKGARVVIQGNSGSFRLGFMYYLVYMIMHQRRVCAYMSTNMKVLLETHDIETHEAVSKILHAVEMHQGFVNSDPRCRQSLWMRQQGFHRLRKHCLRHQYTAEIFAPFARPGIAQQPPDRITLLQTADGQAVHTTFECHNLARNGLPSFEGREAGLQADYIFETSRVGTNVYVTILKARGHTDYVPLPIYLGKVSDYFAPRKTNQGDFNVL